MRRRSRLELLERLEACDAEVLVAASCQEARQLLAHGSSLDAVMVEYSLPDDGWKDVLEEVGRTRNNTDVIVCAPLIDRKVWCEVLNQGGYDLMAEPYPKDEVRNLVEAAATRSFMRSLQECKGLAAAAGAVGHAGAA